jgi:hypothetical protein
VVPGHGQPPLLIRANLYDYHFTRPDERTDTKTWWRCELVGSYSPTVGLRLPATTEVEPALPPR